MSDQKQHFEDQKAGEPASSGSPQKRPSAFAGKGGARERDEECPEGRAESERTLPRRVSRETLGSTEPEKTEATDEITPEQQMLYDIIDRSMAKSQKRPDGEGPEDPAPPQEEPEREQQDAPPPPQKNKPSSFYVYLAVLFGAAFLMLLLAYFVQQRNNETAQSDLRSWFSASRQELLDEIEGLEEEKQELLAEKKALQAQLSDAQANLDGANALYADLLDGYDKYVGYTSILQALYASEVKLEARDYDGAAATLTDMEYQYFVDTIGDYDAEMEHDNPEGLFLRPRFDTLVEELTWRGALDEGWAG